MVRSLACPDRFLEMSSSIPSSHGLFRSIGEVALVMSSRIRKWISHAGQMAIHSCLTGAVDEADVLWKWAWCSSCGWWLGSRRCWRQVVGGRDESDSGCLNLIREFCDSWDESHARCKYFWRWWWEEWWIWPWCSGRWWCGEVCMLAVIMKQKWMSCQFQKNLAIEKLWLLRQLPISTS